MLKGSIDSTAWLIKPDGLESPEFVLHLPAIGETTLENDLAIIKTLPRPEKKRLDHTQSQAPASTDPTRRRGLPEGPLHLNDGYDDDGDDDAHKNKDDKFKLAMNKAVSFEQDGTIDNSPRSDDSYPAGDDSRFTPPPYSWQPGTDLSPVASHA